MLCTGLVLGLGVPFHWYFLFGFIIVQSAHTISPIVLAWSHPEFRRNVVLQKPWKFIGLPLGILVAGSGLGWLTPYLWPGTMVDPLLFGRGGGLPMPVWATMALYSAWNMYHFGMQDFGVLSIYRRMSGSGTRRWDLIFSCAMCWGAMLSPQLRGWGRALGWGAPMFFSLVGLYVVGGAIAATLMLWRERCLPRMILIITNSVGLMSAFTWGFGYWNITSMNHWLTATGLASHVAKRTLVFPLVMIIVGTALYCACWSKGWGFPIQPLSGAIMFVFALTAVHFLYDQWLYKFSRPEVQDTIGRDLFTNS
jgi:hypothetical protein